MKKALISVIVSLLVAAGVSLYFGQSEIAAGAVGGLIGIAPKIIDKIQ